MKRSVESVLVGSVGATLAGLAGSLVGLSIPAAVIGGVNGAVGGWRRVYRWTSPTGALAFVVDSTWALITTAASVVAHAVAAIRRDDSFIPELSERRNRHVYRRGMRLRPGFATTYGNAICGVGNSHSRLVTDHEDVHVWQARWFGPLFPLLYGAWMAGGGAVGALVWLIRRPGSFFRTVESCAYYLNPFEWWAYSRAANWPPSGLVDRLGPRRPAVRAFVDLPGRCNGRGADVG